MLQFYANLYASAWLSLLPLWLLISSQVMMCYSSFEFLLLLNIINATITSYLDYFLNLAVMFSNSNIICIKQVSFHKYPFFKKRFIYSFIYCSPIKTLYAVPHFITLSVNVNFFLLHNWSYLPNCIFYSFLAHTLFSTQTRLMDGQQLGEDQKWEWKQQRWMKKTWVWLECWMQVVGEEGKGRA